MDRRRNLVRHLFILIIGTLYSFSVIRAILPLTILTMPTNDLLILCFGFIFIFTLCLYNKYALLSSAAALLAVLLLAFVSLYLNDFNSPWFIKLMYNLNRLYLFVFEDPVYEKSLNLMTVGIITGAVSLLSVLCLKLKPGFYVLAFAGGAVYISVIFLGSPPSEGIGLIFLCCISIMTMQRLNENISDRKGQHNIIAALICLIVFIAACFIPAPIKEVNPEQVPEFMDRHMAWVDNAIYETFKPKYFSFQSTGFAGENDRLGGAVKLNDRFVMEVYSKEPLYLSGNIKDNYTGINWEKSEALASEEALNSDWDNSYILSNYMDDIGDRGREYTQSIPEEFRTLGLRLFISLTSKVDYNMFIFTPFLLEDFDETYDEVTINIGGSRSKTVFTPQFYEELVFNEPTAILRDGGGALTSEELLEKNSEYSFTVLNWDIKGEMMERYLRFCALTGAVEGMENYLQLPPDLPQRVKELGDSITDGYFTQIDKLKAIEEFLLEYEYTLEPGFVPDDYDFVDYFLFEEKRGYCTYYASAFTVLARSQGIPARYMEGYITPKVKSGNDSYIITNYQAHAWPEAYIKGFGWMPFEPTAPYNYMANNEEIPSHVFSSEMGSEDYEDYMDFTGIGEQTQRESSIVPNQEEQPRVERQAANLRPQSGYAEVWRKTKIIMCIAVIILIIAAAGYLRVRLKFRKIDRLPNDEKVIIYFRYILKCTKVYKYPMARDETPFTYSKRLGWRFAFKNEQKRMYDLAEIFVRASYSHNPITEEDTDLMKSCYHEILNMLRMYRLNKTVLFVYRYVLMII